jgi:GNAT superfamily N-acetyltransferase
VQDVHIRRATLLDVEQIAVFQAACWQEAYRGIVPDAFLDAMDPAERVTNWRRRIEQYEREVAIALDAVGVVGVASWTPGVVDELNTFYVAERAHGTGLSARLLAESIADRPAALWVFANNARARRFYSKHGFRLTGESQIDVGTGVEEVRLSRQ